MTFSSWQSILTEFSHQPTFEAILSDVFGPTLDWSVAGSLQQQWQQGDFSALPPIVLLPGADMPGAAGAYSRERQTIYLNQDWLSLASAEQQVAVLLEELGHHLDNVLNQEDTPGDEGKLFAARVLGVDLSEAQVAELRDADDRGLIWVDGEAVAVERSALPTMEWTRLLGSSSTDYATAITTGTDGSIYVAGSTDGDLDGQTNRGEEDAFITKYNPEGTKAWTRLLGSSSRDVANAITTGANGAIYVAGYTDGDLDGQTNSGIGYAAFITKYAPEGTKVWTQLLGSGSGAVANVITTGGDGAIYVAGDTYGNLDGQIYSGFSDAFITKYTPDGTREWTRLLGSSSTDYATAITTGTDGAIYVAGYTDGDLDGQINGGFSDVFITKYTPDGTREWTRLLGSGSWDVANAITTGTDGAIYVAGSTYGDLDGQTNSGNGDAFITKYAPEGTKVWTRLLGSSSQDRASALTTGTDGAIYVAGYTGGDLDGQTNSGGEWDVFITKLSPGDGALTPVRPTTSVGLNHAFLEVLAKDLVYKDWVNNSENLENKLNESTYNINGFQYRLDSQAGINNGVWGHNEGLGFYAVGLVSDDDGAPPILALRGSGLSDAVDWIDNIDPRGVGFPQFDAYRIAIDQWLNSLGDRGYGPAYITGHSLGGALAQWFGAYYTDFRAKPLAGIVTFNAPGINGTIQHNGQVFGSDTFRPNLADDVTHYIATGDIVSLLGRNYIDGNVRKFSRSDLWAYNPFAPHLDPILVQNLPENGLSKPSGGPPQSLTVQQLNSPLFNYSGYGVSSLQYASLQFLVAKIPKLGPVVADTMRSRGNANRNLDIFRGLANLTVEIGNLGTTALEAAQEAVIAIGNGGAAALGAIQNWGIEAWEAASNMTADAWRNTQNWTANTWESTANFTATQWDNLTGTLNNTVDSTINFISSTVSNIFNTSVTVSLAQPSDTEVSVSYQSVDGTAIAGQDYVAVSGTLVFAPGETEKKIPIQLLNAGSINEAKTFEMQLSQPQNVDFVFGDSILVNIKPNQAPVVQNPITSQTAFVNQSFFFAIPEDTFADDDLSAGDQLTYDVSLADGSPLPDWLTFDSSNGFLFGTPDPVDLANLELAITATDQANKSVSAEFKLDVSVSQDQIVGPTAPDVATLFEGNSENNIFRGSSAADVFDLTAGGANIVKGTLEQLDGDKILGFDINDVLLFKGSQFSPNQFNVTLDPNNSEVAILSVKTPQNYSGLVAFGDSLLDTENQGPFSDGPVLPEYLATALGDIPLANFAFGGATTGIDQEVFTPEGALTIPGLQTQVNQFIADLGSAPVDVDALYTIWAGSNDYTSGTENDPAIVVGNLVNAVTTLQQAGAQNFLLFNLGDLGKLPAINDPTEASALSSLTTAHNQQLSNALGELSGINVTLVDVNSAFDQTLSAIGSDNFWLEDGIHPRTVVHERISDLAWADLARDYGQVGGQVVLEGSYDVDNFLVSSLDGFTKVTYLDDSSDASEPPETPEPFTPIQTVGDLTLGSTQLGYAIQTDDGTLLSVLNNGEVAGPVNDWQALAVDQAAGGDGFTLFWRNQATQQFATWSLDAQGTLLSTELLTPAQVLLAEATLLTDLVGDGNIGPFAFQKGTDGVDELTGQPFTVSFGFGGDDILISGSDSDSFDILIGGAGNDLYRIGPDQTAVILDGGNSPGDVLELVGGSAEGIAFSTIDGGRHLVFDVLSMNSSVVLLDWQDEMNRINKFRAGETAWSYQEVVEQVNATGPQDFSWNQLGGPFDDTLAQLGLNSSAAVDTLSQAYLNINAVGTTS